MTQEQVDTLVSDIAEAIARCDPNRRLYSLGEDQLWWALDRAAKALSLPAPKQLLPPETMPWREVRRHLVTALDNGTDGFDSWAAENVRDAIDLATGSRS